MPRKKKEAETIGYRSDGRRKVATTGKRGKDKGLRMTKKRKEAMRKALKEYIAELEAKERELREAHAFYFFEPNTGEIGDRQREFLKKYLKEEDIPERLDGQIDVFRSRANILLISGGNQSAKSTTGAIMAYILATGVIPEALKGIFPEDKLIKKPYVAIRIVGVDHKTMLNTLIPTYKKWAPKDFLKKGKWSDSFSSEQKKLFLYKDGKGEPIASLEFMTNQQDVESFQGPPLDVVIYDEEPRQDIRKENLMRFVTADKVREIFCWTPTKGLTWMYDLFMEEREGVAKFQLCSVANKMASLEVLDEIMREIDDYNERKMRLLGEFISLSGLVYGKLFDRNVHVIEPFFDNLPPHKKKEYLCLSGWDPHLVTPSAGVFVLVDREENCYVDRCYSREVDTEELKADFWRIVRENGYRMGWSVADKSSDSSIIAFGGRNIYRELSMGKDAIPALRTSEKFEGSIKAGVDEVKKRLRNKSFFIVNRPENKELIQSFKTLERDTYANEDLKGPKDRIREGKHHHHAALRYIFQFPVRWYEHVESAPAVEFVDPMVMW